MLSGPVPVTFFTFMDAKSFSTPFGFIFGGGILDLHVLAIVGMYLLVISVKTYLNLSTKMSDLPIPSFTRDPFFFSCGVLSLCCLGLLKNSQSS